MLAASAWAQAPCVAVSLPLIESDTAISEGRRQKFHENLVAGLKDSAGPAASVLSSSEVQAALAGTPALLRCHEGPCLRQLAERLKADRLILARIDIKTVAGGTAYKIALSVYDRNGAVLPMKNTESCGDQAEGCTLVRAFDSLRRATASIAALATGLAAPLPAVPTEPAAKSAATARPASSAPGNFDAPNKDTETAAPATGPPPSPYAKFYRYGSISAAVATGVFVIASIPFLVFAAKDGQTTCAPSVPRNQCPTIYTGNLGPGLGLLLGGGLLSAGAFGVLFYLDRKEYSRTHR